MRSRPAVAVAAFLLTASAAADTQSPAPPPAFPAAVDMVKVDALVKDSRGKPIRGLELRDFTLFEDGVPQQIESFEAFEPPPAQATATPPPDSLDARVSTNIRPQDSRQPAHFIILFDDVRIAPFRTERGVKAIRSLLESLALPGDRVTIASSERSQVWSGRVGDAREELLAQVQSLRGRRIKSLVEQDVTELEAYLISERQDREALGRAAERIRRHWPQDEAERVAKSEAFEVLGAARARTRATLGTMLWLVRALGETPGRKTLILISEGFPQDPGVPEFRDVISAARRATAVIHNLDLGGLSAPDLRMDQRGDPGLVESDFFFDARASEGSEALASATGGSTVKNTNDFAGRLQTITEDARSYYLLGYRPKNTAPDGKFRRIEVRLKEKGYGVQARPGYYAVDAAAATKRDAETAPPLDLGTEIPLRLAAFVRAPTEQGTTQVRLVVEVDPAAIRFEKKEGILSATLKSSTRVTARGFKEAETQAHTAEIRISPEQLPEAQAGWLPLRRELSLAPGTYEARVQVTDPASGRLGTVRHSFEVPKPDAFRLTTPVLTDQLLPEGGGQEVARRRFAAGSRLLCEFEVLGAHQDGSGGRQVEAGFVLERADGVAVAKNEPLAISVTPDGRLLRRFAVNLTNLPPGEYAIQLVARDLLTKAALTIREPFVIEATAPPPPAGMTPPSVGRPSDLSATTFLDLLGAYRQGDRQQVLQSLLHWPKDQLAGSLRNVENGNIECPPLCIRTAVLLELEFSLLQRSLHSENEADLHSDHARKLARHLDYSDWGFRRDSLLAAGLALLREGKTLVPIDIFSECAKDARVADPVSGHLMHVDGDVECELALADAYEAQAVASLPAAGPFARRPGSARFPRAKALQRARDAYERALRLAPESAEAHLRFGRHLQAMGDGKGAERQLTWILDHSQDVSHRVLAHLFLGRMAEERERFQDAAPHYRAALEEEPTCQAARLALSGLLLRAGRHPEAIEAARGALTAPDDPDPEALESWPAYRLKLILQFESKMRSLSKDLRP